MPLGLRDVVTVPPAVEPVTVAEAKAWGIVQSPDDDSLVSDLIVACRMRVESDLGQALITQTRTLYLGAFPPGWGTIVLPYSPLQSIASVQYTALDGGTGTFDPSNFRFNAGSMPGRLWLPWGTVWPIILPIEDAVRVSYVCGYGDAAAAVPMPIRLAIRSLVAANYAMRESHLFMQGGTVQSTPLYDALVNSADHGARYR